MGLDLGLLVGQVFLVLFILIFGYGFAGGFLVLGYCGGVVPCS